MLENLPGAAPIPAPLARRLEDAVRARGPADEPRTHHLAPDGGPRFTNRLALEGSPYLLQHAHNPVSWWAWGDEPFEEARRTGRPVFLSVGYSTCHWCHVMERESFEDLEIAEVLNSRFVPIKVDREERPDVDAVNMTAVQLLTGGGGWPMSVWLTPEREPFFGGTYFPPRDGARGAFRGFLGMLREIADVYAREPERIRGATGALVGAVRTALSAQGDPASDLPGPETIERAVEFHRGAFDAEHGGLRQAPKFPSSLPVRLLLRHHRRAGDAAILSMATRTLEAIASGGIHDQLAGGFHRYSTDERWLVPHFEKMLYDNALLAVAYAEAWQVTGRRDFARVVRTTLDYLGREMTSPEGGLYSATDADSEGHEGRFFVWEERELRDVLGADAEPFLRFYGVTPGGNFEGRSILWVPKPDEDAWEALAPVRAWRAGDAGVPAFLEDHAFVVAGLLDLHEATLDPRWLEAAVDLCERQERLFGDEAGAWFQTASDHERLLAREKPSRDGAEPSGASVAILNALRLHALTTDDRWWRTASGALRHYAGLLEAQPAALGEMLLAVDFATDTVPEVVLVWPEGEPAPEPFLSVLRRTFLPSRALCGAPEGEGVARIGRTAKVAAGKAAAGRPTAYVCERGACQLPAISPDKLASQLAPVHRYH